VRFAIACVFALMIHSGATAAPFSFNDVRFWVGVGENRAALVIDWFENAADPPALVWGYRWDGAATGANMLTAILAADERLFAKLGGTPANPIAVYGLGYDADGDGFFEIDDGTMFNADGIAYTGPADLAVASDAGDYYAEGWFTGVWHYGIAAGNPFAGAAWAHSVQGMASRALADGAWDSWSFESPISFTAFAENPQAATSPFPPGDYDRDGHVDVDDYARWKELYGSTTDPSADGNYNGIVDAADYTVWRNHLSEAAAVAAVQPRVVPEPITVYLTMVALSAVLCSIRRRTNDANWLAALLCCFHRVVLGVRRARCRPVCRRSVVVRRGDDTGARFWHGYVFRRRSSAAG